MTKIKPISFFNSPFAQAFAQANAQVTTQPLAPYSPNTASFAGRLAALDSTRGAWEAFLTTKSQSQVQLQQTLDDSEQAKNRAVDRTQKLIKEYLGD